jgi:hypothetical protein
MERVSAVISLGQHPMCQDLPIGIMDFWNFCVASRHIVAIRTAGIGA